MFRDVSSVDEAVVKECIVEFGEVRDVWVLPPVSVEGAKDEAV